MLYVYEISLPNTKIIRIRKRNSINKQTDTHRVNIMKKFEIYSSNSCTVHWCKLENHCYLLSFRTHNIIVHCIKNKVIFPTASGQFFDFYFIY